MGSLTARDLAYLGNEDGDLRTALSWHLTSNHFPPVPTIMVDTCIEAINNANDGEWDKLVSLPEGVGYKGLTVAPTHAIVEQHHLDSFLECEE
jgi:hypothetical protein